ncbi:peptidoglycan recognition family protein [Fodinicola feengrottensis]|uniref:N-acetylmuramoyl-L-alanine amidase n=2 Tax=Fodinicola feengrottensis TaxID=435914 RepID=A0ABN2G3S5_9ACTN
MNLTDMSALRAAWGKTHADDSTGDARGDASRPLTIAPAATPKAAAVPTAAKDDTLPRAAGLLGVPASTLRSNPAQNVRGGAVLLAAQARQLGHGALPTTVAGWYPAVKALTGSDEYAADTFDVIRTGATRTTAEGQSITLPADQSVPASLATSTATNQAGTECPPRLGCDFVPAAYALDGDGTDKGNYGNYDLANRPKDERINTIVIHDTEVTYAKTLSLFQDPAHYAASNYVIRSADGHVTQAVATKNVVWHAGNWYVNSHSLGIEHEGFADAGGTWYTEEMYRSSARLVRYLAARFNVPLDRQHIYGHDNVPGLTAGGVSGMHWDPAAYWNWQHYFELLGAPLHGLGYGRSSVVMILPSARRTEPLMSCPDPTQGPSVPIPGTGTSMVQLHTAPSATAPLISDPALHPDGSAGTTRNCDWGDKAAAGQIYSVADRQGDWTAIWYDGLEGWFQDSRQAPAAVQTHAVLVTPKQGLASVPVYGGAYPNADEYPSAIPAHTVAPLQYTLKAGQEYAFGGVAPTEYYYAQTIDNSLPMDHTVVRGKTVFYQIQLGHRVAFVKASDVRLTAA